MYPGNTGRTSTTVAKYIPYVPGTSYEAVSSSFRSHYPVDEHIVDSQVGNLIVLRKFEMAQQVIYDVYGSIERSRI